MMVIKFSTNTTYPIHLKFIPGVDAPGAEPVDAMVLLLALSAIADADAAPPADAERTAKFAPSERCCHVAGPQVALSCGPLQPSRAPGSKANLDKIRFSNSV
eukprot:COSAG05_NODE_1000_length_6247_cov_23.555628_5_plen_102_part_00